MKQRQHTNKSTLQTQQVEKKERRASNYEFLEPIEEKVLRMHYGLSENDDKVLEYAVGASEDAKWRLSLMEANNVAELDADCPTAEGADKQLLKEFVQKL